MPKGTKKTFAQFKQELLETLARNPNIELDVEGLDAVLNEAGFHTPTPKGEATGPVSAYNLWKQYKAKNDIKTEAGDWGKLTKEEKDHWKQEAKGYNEKEGRVKAEPSGKPRKATKWNNFCTKMKADAAAEGIKRTHEQNKTEWAAMTPEEQNEFITI